MHIFLNSILKFKEVFNYHAHIAPEPTNTQLDN